MVLAGCGHATDSKPSHANAVTVLLPTEVQEIDPRFAADAYSLKVSRLLFASLMSIDPHSLLVVPDLAEDLQVLDPVTYRVRLRPGLRFSDGSILNAHDVKAMYQSVVDKRLATRYAQTYRRIRQITVTDDRTIVFELSEPHATFVTDLELPILPRRYRHQRVPAAPSGHVVSSGPYRVCGSQGESRLLCANRHWYKGKATSPVLRLMVVRDDNTRAMRLLAGAADLALNSVPPLLVPLFEGDKRFSIQSIKGVGTTYMGVRTDATGLRDRRVRQALAYAIDRKALIKAKFGQRAVAARGFVPEGHWAYDTDLPEYTCQPQRARELLAEARRDGVVPGKLRLRTSADRLRLSIGRAIATMLRSVGFVVDVWPSETATLFDDLRDGRYELAILALPEVFEPHVLSWFFGSEHVPSKTAVGANRWRYRNPELDSLFVQGIQHTALAERRPIYQQVQAVLARDLPAIPLWHEHNVAVVRAARLPHYRVPRDGRFGTLALR